VAVLALSACNDIGGPVKTYSVPGQGLFAGDIDGDNDIDLITGGGDSWAVLINDGTGKYTSTVIDGHVDYSHMVLMDVNNDAKADMVLETGNNGDPTHGIPPQAFIETRLSNGDGTFGDPTAFGSVPAVDGNHAATAIIAGDANGDGHKDYVAYQSVQGSPGKAITWLWNGSNSFAAPITSTSSSPVLTEGHLNHCSTIETDVTGDGKADLVIAGWAPADPDPLGYMTVLVGNGAGGFTATRNYPTIAGTSTRAIGPGVGDFNEDGRPDIVVADTRLDTGVNTLTFWFGNASGGLNSPVQRTGKGEDDTDLQVADLNGDGHKDIVTIARLHSDDTKGSGWLMLGTGTGQISNSSELDAAVPHDFGHGGVLVRELNGDNYPDIAMDDGRDASNVLTVMLDK
jgi:hypothetical protein